MENPVQTFREMALSFNGTEENPHHDRAAFKITGKRIFCTLHESSLSANVRLSPELQKDFIQSYHGIFAVDNKWGQQGWTTFDLKEVEGEVIKAALEYAYEMAIL